MTMTMGDAHEIGTNDAGSSRWWGGLEQHLVEKLTGVLFIKYVVFFFKFWPLFFSIFGHF